MLKQHHIIFHRDKSIYFESLCPLERYRMIEKQQEEKKKDILWIVAGYLKSIQTLEKIRRVSRRGRTTRSRRHACTAE